MQFIILCRYAIRVKHIEISYFSIVDEVSEFCKKDDDFWGMGQTKVSFSPHLSITWMEVFVTFRKYQSLLALVKNTIHTLVFLFHDWCVAKTSLRTEFLAKFNRENILSHKLLYSSLGITPLRRDLFPLLWALSCDLLLNLDQGMKSHFTWRDPPVYPPRSSVTPKEPNQKEELEISPNQ